MSDVSGTSERVEKPTFWYPCPTCGVAVTTSVGYRARLAYPCLACLREQSGWTGEGTR